MANKRILITGSSGLVGNVFRNISHNYSEYTFVYATSSDCDLTSYEKTLDFFQQIKPNYVFHLAAHVGGLYKNMNFKVDMLEKNILMNFNVVKCSHLINVDKCICMLSTCIFPDKTSYPIDETMLHNGPPHTSNDAYAYAKRMMETHCQSYNEQYNTNYSCIIPTNIYGPHDNFSLKDGHVIPALIHKCYLAKKSNIPFEVYGSGRPLRQFIYSDDLAKIMMMSFEKLTCENLIISNSTEYSIKEIAILIAKEFDYEDHIVFNEQFSDGQHKKTANNTKMNTFVPNYEFIDISVGIHKSVEFFKENIETNSCRI